MPDNLTLINTNQITSRQYYFIIVKFIFIFANAIHLLNNEKWNPASMNVKRL